MSVNNRYMLIAVASKDAILNKKVKLLKHNGKLRTYTKGSMVENPDQLQGVTIFIQKLKDDIEFIELSEKLNEKNSVIFIP